MFNFDISSNFGNITIGPLTLSWGNAIDDLPGFACIGLGSRSLEFGDIDQGKPGIYLTGWENDEPYCVRTIWQAK